MAIPQHVDMTPVISTNIDEIGHDPQKNHLYVVFKKGDIYRYENFDQQLFGILVLQTSIGKWLRQNVFYKPKHPYKKL